MSIDNPAAAITSKKRFIRKTMRATADDHIEKKRKNKAGGLGPIPEFVLLANLNN
jgi:hypothetical protein